MKIALIGSAPSSMGLAPYGDPNFQIWACSPGTYFKLPRCDAFFELHRPQFGTIGRPESQVSWFSPEYVAWIGLQKRVWVAPRALAECRTRWPNAEAYPKEEMDQKFGNLNWHSSLSYMLAMAIDLIIAEREKGNNEEHEIGMWGVDMAADEEYADQKGGCQHFLGLAHFLGIKLTVPPESDILCPKPAYGIDESEPWHIKNLARMNELKTQEAHFGNMKSQMERQQFFFAGAISDHEYHMRTRWDRDAISTNIGIIGASPHIRGYMREVFDAEARPKDVTRPEPGEVTLNQVADAAVAAGVEVKFHLAPLKEEGRPVTPGKDAVIKKPRKSAKKTTKRK